jgi:hypothetical protein
LAKDKIMISNEWYQLLLKHPFVSSNDILNLSFFRAKREDYPSFEAEEQDNGIKED